MATLFKRIAMSIVPKTTVEAVVLCLVSCVLGWMFIDLLRIELASRRGTVDAHADMARGDFRYNLRGLAQAWDKTAIEIAQRDYGIRIVRTGGCVCGGPDCSYDHAYNRVVRDYFTRRLGYDPIERAFEQARLEWNKQRIHDVALASDVAQQSHALEPAAEPVSNGESSLPDPTTRSF
jgi:hypothetical protein